MSASESRQVGNRAFGDRLLPSRITKSRLAARSCFYLPTSPAVHVRIRRDQPFQYFVSHATPSSSRPFVPVGGKEFEQFGWGDDVPIRRIRDVRAIATR